MYATFSLPYLFACIPSPDSTSDITPRRETGHHGHDYDIGLYADTNTVIDDATRLHILQHPWVPPKHFVWPTSIKRQADGRERERRITPANLAKHPWLAYSPSRRGFFCRICVLFGRSTVGATNCAQHASRLVLKPLDVYNKLTGKDGALDLHASAKYHQEAVAAGASFKQAVNNPTSDIRSAVSSQWSKEHEKHVEALRSIVETVLLCGKRNLPLRGDDDAGRVLIEEGTSGGKAEGVFRSLLRFRAENDETLKKHLQHAPANALHTSPQVQNELIGIIGDKIQKTIVDTIKNAKNSVFTILADETSDITQTEQLSICLRYLSSDGTAQERFVGFWDLHTEAFELDFKGIEDGDTLEPKLTGKKVGEVIVSVMGQLGLDTAFCVGQGYDGAAMMSSDTRGAAAHVKDKCPHANYVHCSSHCLNLALVTASKQPAIRNMHGTLRDTVTFINASPKRRALFDAAVRHVCPETKRQRLKSLCETRWVERHDAVECFLELLEAIVLALRHMSRWRDTSTSSKAGTFLAAIQQPEFVAALCVTADVTSVTHSLSRQLQTETSDLSAATDLVRDDREVLRGKRRQAGAAFKAVYGDIEGKLKAIDAPLHAARRTCERQMHRGVRLSEDATPEDCFRINIYIPFLEDLITQLETRFTSKEVAVMTVSRLIPSHPQFADTDDEWLVSAFELYEPLMENVSVRQFRAECLLWQQMWSRLDKTGVTTFTAALKRCDPDSFPGLWRLLGIVVCQPLTTASAERAFSTLRRVKTWLRNRIGQSRLSALALMNCHPDLAPSTDEVVAEFLGMKKRRLTLTK